YPVGLQECQPRSLPTAVAYRSRKSFLVRGLPGRAPLRRAHAIPARLRRSSAPESLRTRSLAESLACLEALASQNLNETDVMHTTSQESRCNRRQHFLLRSLLASRFFLVGLVTHRIRSALLLIHPSLREAHRQRTHACNDTHALSDRNGSPRIENVEQMRTLQTKIVRGEQRKPMLRRRRRHGIVI